MDPTISESPFAPPSVNSHPRFAPIKSGGAVPDSTALAKNLKPPKPPEKPLMPYMRYSRKVWESVKAANQDKRLSDIGRIIGQMWRELNQSEKQVFVDEWEIEKVEYQQLLKTYQNSPAYQQYIAVKDRLAGPSEGKDWRTKSSAGQPNDGARQSIPVLDTVPDPADDLDSYSSRQSAANRYSRNQRLLMEVFGPNCVPDLRTVVTDPRMNMLKRQVHSLSTHQKKLEAELEQLEERFESKKRCLQESSQNFSKRLQELQEPAASPLKYKEMVDKASEQLLKDYELYKEKRAEEGGSASADPSSSTHI